MSITKLGAYGNTELSAQDLRDCLTGGSRTKEIDVFFMNTPHSGGSSEQITVTFDSLEGDNEEILIGHLPSGTAIAFFLRAPSETTTFVVEKTD